MKINNVKTSASLAVLIATLGISSAHGAEPVSVSASDHDGNLPDYTLDNSLSTRWSANGDGQYIRYDMGEILNIDSVDIAFFKGNQREAEFEIQTSENGSEWFTVFSGFQAESTLDQQRIELAESAGRYVQIVGYGNTSNSWNSITEVDINTSSINTPSPTPSPTTELNLSASASSNDGNVPANVLDENLSTRWSANGDGQWLQLDLGASFTLTGVEIAFFKGDQRSALFDIQLSEDGSNWDTILSDETSSGSDLSSETFSFSASTASFVRYVGYGNSSNTWNSLTEMNVLVSSSSTPAPSPSPTPSPAPTPTPVTPTPSPTPTAPTPTPSPTPISGASYSATPDSLNEVLGTVSGGDEIILSGSGEISLKNYDFDKPVLIRAASIGGTTLTNATITNSNNISLQGFTFGPNDESTLLKIVNSTNIKILRNLFDHKDISESQTSIVMTQASQYIEIAYNEFRDKNISDNGGKVTGSFIKTQFDDPLMTKNLHVHHNHFNNIAPYLVNGTPAGDSDREAIAMGIADSQDVVTNNLIEYNLFENCDGENEIITVKTSNNIFRYNTFKNSMGSLSFRLGSNNEAYENYFYGEGPGNSVTDENYQTGGIRVYGSGHTISDNYMEDLTGVSWRRPILIDSGDTSDSTGGDSHETSSNLDVYNNVIVNSTGGGIHIGSDNYGNQPRNITVGNNTVVADEGIAFNNHADHASNIWTGNRAYVSGSANAVAGGALGSAEVEMLNSSPSLSTPAFLSADDVGRFADE